VPLARGARCGLAGETLTSRERGAQNVVCSVLAP
jgi:hypothetical protein